MSQPMLTLPRAAALLLAPAVDRWWERFDAYPNEQ